MKRFAGTVFFLRELNACFFAAEMLSLADVRVAQKNTSKPQVKNAVREVRESNPGPSCYENGHIILGHT